MNNRCTAITTSTGKRCKRKALPGSDRCAIPSHAEDVVQECPGANVRARARDWESVYFKALERGHTKESAAGVAGVSAATPYKRVQRGDTAFAEQEDIHYNRGLGMLMEVARRRILDPKRPGDLVLKHLLSVRGVSERVQVTGADDGPVITRIERVIVYPENRNDDADADPKADAAAGPEAQDDAA